MNSRLIQQIPAWFCDVTKCDESTRLSGAMKPGIIHFGLISLILVYCTTSISAISNDTYVRAQPSWNVSNKFYTNFNQNEKFAISTLYVGYANNPFGPSQKAKHKKMYKSRLHPQPFSSNLKMLPSTMSSVSDADLLQNTIDDIDPISSTLAENDASEDEVRSKRGVLHLYNMVSCATGCNPLIYKGYGCYCGFLGSGYPVDGIDRCCKMHDWCYETAGCPLFFEYVIPYYWKCYRRRPVCAVEHGDWGSRGSCAQRLCECDRALSECLRRYPCPRNRALCTSSPWRLLQNTIMIF